MHFRSLPALAAAMTVLVLTTGCNSSSSTANNSSAETDADINVVGLRTQVQSVSNHYHELYPDEFYYTLQFQVAVAGENLPDDVHSIEAWYPEREEWSHLTDTAILVGPHANDMYYSDGVFYSNHLYRPASWGGGPDVYQRLQLDGWQIRVTDRDGGVHLLDLTLDVPPEDADSSADHVEALQYQDSTPTDIRTLGLVSGTIKDITPERVTLDVSYEDPRVHSFHIVVYSALEEEDKELRPLGETQEYRVEDLNIAADGQALELTFSRDDLIWWGRPGNPEQEYFTSDIVEYRIFAHSAPVEKEGFPYPEAAFSSIHRHELPEP
ncbi:hypothetical protein E4656_08490 [Natronospirillum operosum]|uniref:DUF4861 domain-containing protein n=1 Tax=Natronospirillum operosum TaxID=2759953 RepID=A0A4Z0WG44_9GAMM|nr:hypothetical protein [Natronospirillum operosum]TGG94196.1 hypothetical protein E4656_08490 [Natronospirillum operosum]